MILYRPVGLQELALIYDSGMEGFPARLPQQPIFYPVLDLEYARQTASGWNAKNGQLAGYVTQFKVDDDYISKLEQHQVGKSQYQELWIPAEQMEEFNRHIQGHIKVVEAHFGADFEGFIPEQHALRGKNAVEQFTLLSNSFVYKRMEFYLELKRNHKAVFLNYPFWLTYESKNPGLKAKVLQGIREAWMTSFPKTPLPQPPPSKEDAVAARHASPPAWEPVEPEEQTSTAPPLAEPPEQSDPPSRVNPPYEERAPVERRTSPVLTHLLPEDIQPVEEDEFEDRVEPVRMDNQPVEEPEPYIAVDPAPEQFPAGKPGGFHFLRGAQPDLREQAHEDIETWTRAVEGHPGDVTARTSLGVAFHRAGDDERALATYEAVLRLDPSHAEAHYFRANILYQRGDVRQAIDGYTLAIGLRPELIDAHQQPAPMDRLTDYSPIPAEMYRIARPARRILQLDRSLAANPRQAGLLKERADAYSRLRNYGQAIKDYSSALALQPDEANLLHLRGLTYEQLGQNERALQDFQRAIALDPQLSDLYIHRGVTFGRMGNLRQSIDSLTEGIRLAPGNPDAYFNRGTAYFQQGNYERAIADFSMVIQLSSNDEAAYYWRGVSNEEAGRQNGAIADYRQFLMLSKDPQARAEVERRLRRWDAGPQDNGSSLQTGRQEPQRKESSPPGTPARAPDIHDLVTALGRRALHSVWFGSGVECEGEKARQLSASTGNDRPIRGRDFLMLTSGVRRTTAGDFQAVDPGAEAHWLFIRAWEGSGFYIEINDPEGMQRLKSRFPTIEDAEGAQAPYQGLFLRI